MTHPVPDEPRCVHSPPWILRGNVFQDSDDIGMTNPPGKGFNTLPMAGVGGRSAHRGAGGQPDPRRDNQPPSARCCYCGGSEKGGVAAPAQNAGICRFSNITMLALAQADSYDPGCEPLPSISNLMADGCSADKKVTAITPSDHRASMRRGFYRRSASPALYRRLQQQASTQRRRWRPLVPAKPVEPALLPAGSPYRQECQPAQTAN